MSAGTGYCDARCPTDVKFVNGKSNTLNGLKFPGDTGGRYGECQRITHVLHHAMKL